MKADALLRVTETLRDRLKLALAAYNWPGEKVFVGPLDDADASGAALILFLYRIAPNASLRNHEHRVPADNPPPVAHVFRNSTPLDLHFLLTVGTIAGGSEERLLGALGMAIQALQADPELSGPALSYETVHVSLEPLTTEEASRIWALFPTANYRTSIAYLVSPVWVDPQLPDPAAAPVVEDELFEGHRALETEP